MLRVNEVMKKGKNTLKESIFEKFYHVNHHCTVDTANHLNWLVAFDF